MTPYQPLTRQVAAAAAAAPDAAAICSRDRRVTYAELWGDIGRVAGYLVEHGVRPGDRVAVLAPNSPEYVSAYYGALAAGAVAVGLNSEAHARELAPTLGHCQARWLFADARHPDLRALAAALPDLTVVTTEQGRSGSAGWPTGDSRPHPPVDVGPDDRAAIHYTSGTTGRPKGVTLTHGNLAANTSSILAYLALGRADRVLNVLPFFCAYGSSVLHTHLAVGATIVLENSLAFPARIPMMIEQERITGFPGVPSTFALLQRALESREHDLSSLRYVTQAGSAMPIDRIRHVTRALPRVQFIVMYGQTEATARLTYLPPARLEEKPGSVGIPVAGVEISIRDDRGRPLPPGNIGEVCARGGNVMAGYFMDSDATAAVLRDGWLHTGDLGHLDTEGFLYIQCRRSDIIKCGAHRINPREIAEVIAELTEVAEAAVVGVADDVLGESIKAVVRLEPGAILSASDVQRHCAQQLPRYKVPKVVEFATDLPRTSSGKVMTYQLR